MEEEKVLVNFRLPRSLHERLKLAAKVDSRSMNSALEAMVKDYVLRMERKATREEGNAKAAA